MDNSLNKQIDIVRTRSRVTLEIISNDIWYKYSKVSTYFVFSKHVEKFCKNNALHKIINYT